MKKIPAIMVMLGTLLAMNSCVKKSVYEDTLRQLAENQEALKKTNSELDETNKKLTAKENDYNKLSAEKQDSDDRLNLAMERNATLSSQLATMGQNVEELTDERSRMANEKNKMEEELESLRRLRMAAEKRSAQYSQLLNKLRSMIDAGTLKVTIRKGQMMVQLSNDILFPPGGTKLKAEGEAAIVQLAETIREFTDRRFLVVGHSDNTPIKTARYPSNWELSSQRAIEVVRILVDNGVAPGMLMASGQAEFDPLSPNDSDEAKSNNRRVEVIFMPAIEELPAYSEGDENAAQAQQSAPAQPAAAN